MISEVTDAVIEEVKAWQSRPLEPLYAIVYLDALYVKMRHETPLNRGPGGWCTSGLLIRCTAAT